MNDTGNRKPIKTFGCGSVKAAIWADSRVINNAVVEVHSVRIDRSYKDPDSGEWKHTDTFNAEDLPKVAIVAIEVYKHLRLRSFDQEHVAAGLDSQNSGLPTEKGSADE
jgi:hypothetical protein